MPFGYSIDIKNKEITFTMCLQSSEDRWGTQYEGGGIKIVCPFPEKPMALREYMRQVMVEPMRLGYFKPGSTVELRAKEPFKPGSRFEFWGLPIISKLKRKERSYRE